MRSWTPIVIAMACHGRDAEPVDTVQPGSECAQVGALADAPICADGTCPRCHGPSCDPGAAPVGVCDGFDDRTIRVNVDDRTTLYCDADGAAVAVSIEVPSTNGCPTTWWWGEDLSGCVPVLEALACDTAPEDTDPEDTDAVDTDVVDTDRHDTDLRDTGDTDTDATADTDAGTDTDTAVDTDACADTGCGGPQECETGLMQCIDIYHTGDTAGGWSDCALVCRGGE